MAQYQPNTHTTAQISVEPLWDPVVGNTTQMCHFIEERNTSQGMDILHGSAKHTCSLQINASLGYYTLIEIPESGVSNESFFLYVERRGDLDICTNKYVIFNGNPNACSIILLHESLYLNLTGNVSILVTGISASEINPVCPESNNNISHGINQSQTCKRVKGYNNHITCRIFSWSDHICNIKFPYDCNATVGHREVAFQCYDHGLLKTKSSLISYTVGIGILDYDYEKIVTLEGQPFQGLNYVQELYLNRNYLTELRKGVFIGLSMLRCLYISSNQLVHLYDDSFEGLVMLQKLDLSNNKLTTLPVCLFRMVPYQNTLNLDNDQMTLNESTFDRLTGLNILYLTHNNLISLPDTLFHELDELKTLYLQHTQILSLNESIFDGLTGLNKLDLSYNNLTSLPDKLFKQLENLHNLDLEFNKLMTLPNSMFNITNSLNESLILANNQLKILQSETFNELTLLGLLCLDNNPIEALPNGIFNALRSLNTLYMRNNKLVTLSHNVFHSLSNLEVFAFSNQLMKLSGNIINGLSNLVDLHLSNNRLVQLGKNILKGLTMLVGLYLNDNSLTHIDIDIFNDTINIESLDLSANQLTKFPNIKYLSQLTYLDVRSNPLTAITHDSFLVLNPHLQLRVVASQHEICECYFRNCNPTISTSTINDKPNKRSPYLTCDRLLSDRALAVMMWIIGINALGGNIFVLVWRKIKTKSYKVQDLLLSNLAMSDSLMGFYMVIIASADVYYDQYFPMQSETWRTGIICRVAGSISIASTQLSVFFLTLISIDRFIGIKYPMSDKKLSKRSTIAAAVIIWVCSVALGVVPSIVSGWNFKFYDNSHVCIGLPLALTKVYKQVPRYSSGRFRLIIGWESQFASYVDGLYFSTAIFLGLNGLCYIVILGCYIEIFRAHSKSAKAAGRTPDKDEQMRLTRKITAIVATNFVCVFPLIVLGILVQTRALVLPASVYAWSVTIILPINSAINPYLYTIAEIISNRRKKN